MIKLFVHRHKCIGCNYCVEQAPERWQMSKRDGKCVLIGGKKKGDWVQVTIPEHELEANKRASEVCPVSIIRVQT